MIGLAAVKQRLCHSVSQVGEQKQDVSRLEEEKQPRRLSRSGQPTPHSHPHLVQPGEVIVNFCDDFMLLPKLNDVIA